MDMLELLILETDDRYSFISDSQSQKLKRRKISIPPPHVEKNLLFRIAAVPSHSNMTVVSTVQNPLSTNGVSWQ